MRNGKKIEQGGVFGALLTDLSKASDCIPHDLIIAKLEAYGLEIGALRLIYAYLINRKQRVKVNEAYSSWKDIIFGVPFVVWLPLLLEILRNMCIVIVYSPGCDDINLEINLIFLIKNLNILRTKRAFKVK